jgi:hypothetical protein
MGKGWKVYTTTCNGILLSFSITNPTSIPKLSTEISKPNASTAKHTTTQLEPEALSENQDELSPPPINQQPILLPTQPKPNQETTTALPNQVRLPPSEEMNADMQDVICAHVAVCTRKNHNTLFSNVCC